MNRFWDRYTGPLLGQIMPLHILEIGGRSVPNVRRLLVHCRENGCKLDIIAAEPSAELIGLVAEFGAELCTLHVGPSVDLVDECPAPDVAMLDSDCNWHMVYAELGMMRRRALSAEQPLPVILVHNAAWPYARRDMYRNPDALSEMQRKPFAYKGMLPDVSELVEDGINGWCANALIEGGPENGVLTAVEDFAAAIGGIHVWTVPFFNGLGILMTDERKTPEVDALIENFYSSETMIETCKALEAENARMQAALFAERRRLEIRTDALERARRVLAERNARIATLEASLSRDGAN